MTNQADKDLFRTTVDDNIPIDKDGIFLQTNNLNKYDIFKSYCYITSANLSGSDKIAYAQNGVSNKIIKQMKQGKIANAPMLDLHGQTIVEACQSLSKFIHYHQHQSFIHVIHGKGYHSNQGLSLLKTQVVSFLKQHPQVCAFYSCPPKDGGTGAVFVCLKKIEKPYF